MLEVGKAEIAGGLYGKLLAIRLWLIATLWRGSLRFELRREMLRTSRNLDRISDRAGPSSRG
jgi:hypothetical protein